jgi:lysyl-tRNA synthetase class 2
METIFQNRILKLKKLEKLGCQPYSNDFTPTHDISQVRKFFEEHPHDQKSIFKIAGRMISLRSFGKAAFFDLTDRTAKLQIYLRKDKIGKEQFEIFKLLDIGDIVGITGSLFKTKTGELTLLAQKIKLLSKSLRPLPEKWHGLKDIEIRYRQRYLDLISRPQTKIIFEIRALILNTIRNFLNSQGFIEVETPMMQTIPGGAAARPFITHHNALNLDLYLRIAPELYLKRLVIGGLERVYEIGRVFRNEGISTQHNPEFTMLELYQAYTTYKELMELLEEMITTVDKEIKRHFPEIAKEKRQDLSLPWKRIKMIDIIKEYIVTKHPHLSPLDNSTLKDLNSLEKWLSDSFPEALIGKEHGEKIIYLFENLVEPYLEPSPIFIIDYPSDISPLARKNDQDPFFADRFELYIQGIELANAFSELCDPIDQKERFLLQAERRKKGDEEAMEYDTDFILALEHGMPPCAGLGLGIDRLLMVLTNIDSIREAILFPLLKPK